MRTNQQNHRRKISWIAFLGSSFLFPFPAPSSLFWHSSGPKRVREFSSCSGEPLTICGFLTGFRGIPLLVFFSSWVWGIWHLLCNYEAVLGTVCFCKCGVVSCLSWTVLVYVCCSECLLIPASFIPRSSPIWTISHCVSHLDSEDFRNLFSHKLSQTLKGRTRVPFIYIHDAWKHTCHSICYSTTT